MAVKFGDLRTDKDRIEFMRNKLLNDDRWILRGMFAIYQRQTADEQTSESTRYWNNIGFTGADALLLSSFTKQMMKRGFEERMNQANTTIRSFFSEKQEFHIRKRMPKYARQLVKISTGRIQ